MRLTGRGVGRNRGLIVMAASVTSTLPMIVMFFLARRYFVRGLVTGYHR
jgi:ABC-type glycerol-3-phosphate transport system permease component